MAHKIVNGREEKTEMTGLLPSSQYRVEVFGIDKRGQPYKTLEVQAKTLTGKNIALRVFLYVFSLSRTGGSVKWASVCHAGGREFDSGRTITQGLKITE